MLKSHDKLKELENSTNKFYFIFRFTFNLCVDSATNPKIYPPEYIAFHFRTNFDQTGGSYVVLNYKKGENNWGPEEIKENTWIDDLGSSKFKGLTSLINRFLGAKKEILI